MSRTVLILFMALAGAATTLQPSVNGRLAQKIGAMESAFVSFAVGTLALLALVLVRGEGHLRALPQATWWEWTGGLLGALYVTALIVAIPRLGTTVGFAAAIASQLITALLLDATGFFGFGVQPVTPSRLAGVALLFLGAWLVRG